MLTAVLCNKYSFCCIRGLTPFCPKINSRENRFFAARLAIGDENGSHSVKIYADKLTKASPPTPLRKGKASPLPLSKRWKPHPQPLSKGWKPHPQPLSKGRGEWYALLVDKGSPLSPLHRVRGVKTSPQVYAKCVAVCMKRALVWWPTIYIMVSAMHFAVTDNTCLFGLVYRS